MSIALHSQARYCYRSYYSCYCYCVVLRSLNLLVIAIAYVIGILVLLLHIQIPMFNRCCSLEIGLRSNAAVRLRHLPGHFRVSGTLVRGGEGYSIGVYRV